MTNFLRRTAWPCLSAIAIAALTQSAAAQITSTQQSAIRSNCRSDFMSKCSGVTPGGKDALMCLQKNVASLSGGCQTAVRATMPAEAAPKMAAPAAAPPPAAATAEPAPAAKPATIVSAPPPPAKMKRPVQHPAAAAAVTPPPPPPPPPAAPQPAAAAAPSGMVPGGMLVEKACARYIFTHCRSAGFGTGPKVACLVNYVKAGNFVGPRCRGALTLTGQLH